MNSQNAKQYLPLIQALAEGKTIQVLEVFNFSPYWKDLDEFVFNKSPDNYRIKPEATLRPWRPEEVPVGALYRAKNSTGYCAMITGYSPSNIHSSVEDAGPCDNGWVPFAYCLDTYEHSLDHGKTWQPCGVYE